MDPLTHTLAGVQLGLAPPGKRVRERVLLVVAASLLPDIDFFIALLQGPLGFLMRRMYTHSLLGLTVGATVLALILRRWMTHRSFANIFGWLMLGGVVHVFLDLLNSYGVVLLHPASLQRFEFGCVFIIDLWVWGLLTVPLLFALLPIKALSARRMARFSVLTTSLYIALCFYARAESLHLMGGQASSSGQNASYLNVFPEPLGPHRFRGVVRSGDKYLLYLVEPFSGKVSFAREVATEEGAPQVERIRQEHETKRLEWFFAAPVWKSEGEGADEKSYVVGDLRFTSLVLGFNRHPFRFRFNIEGEAVTGPVRLENDD